MKNQELYKKQSDDIWEIANLIRGPYRPPQYRRVMIPLIVLRRLDCVLEATKDQVLAEHKKLKAQEKYDEETIEKMINRKFKMIAIENVITSIDRMLNASFTAIQLYTEYRSALITAAVTGKIDVSNIQLPQQEAA